MAIAAGHSKEQAAAASASSASAHLATTYLALALKGDASIVKCDAAQAAAAQNLSQTKLSRAKTAALACLALYDSYTAGLQGMAWGAAQPRADAVIAAMAAIHSLLAEMSNATTSAAFRAAYDKMPAATTALRTAANALRAALGLPPSKA